MCDFGITAAITSIVVGVAGAVTGGISSYQQNKSAAQSAQYQAQVAAKNRKIAEDNAVTARQTGYEDANKQRMKTAQMVASQRTAMGANGIDADFGTGMDLTDSTKYYGEMDALTTVQNAQSRADAFLAQGDSYGLQSKMYSDSSKNYNNGAWLTGLGTGLGNAGKVAAHWYTPGVNKGSTGTTNKTSNGFITP